MIFKSTNTRDLICVLTCNRASASINDVFHLNRFVGGYSRIKIEELGWKLIAPEGLLVWQE